MGQRRTIYLILREVEIRLSTMAIEPLRDNLDTLAATDQPYEGDSSSQQQLTVDSYDLSGPLFLAQPTTTGASTYLHAAATSPGLCNFNSSLGQNQFPIAPGGSPAHHQSRSNDALHSISQMLMEDVDERVDICQGEAALQAAEKPFRDILGEVYASATNCTQMYSNNKPDNPDKDYSSYNVLQPSATPLCPYICNRSPFLPNQPLISVGWTSEYGFPALHCQRGVEEEQMFAPSIDKLVIYLENGILCITKLTTNAKVGERGENTIFEVADQRGWGILEGRSNKHLAFTSCEIIRYENFDRVLLCYGWKSSDQTARLT